MDSLRIRLHNSWLTLCLWLTCLNNTTCIAQEGHGGTSSWRPVVLMHGLDAAAESMSHAQGMTLPSASV